MTEHLYLPAPAPYSGPDRCGSCLGAGVTGARHELPLPQVNLGGVLDPEVTVLVVDEICDECQGCGRDPDHHDTCTAAQHIEWQPVDYTFVEEPCALCSGRGWFPVRRRNDQQAAVLRVPCGCTEHLLVAVP
jgi:hypothetical protein